MRGSSVPKPITPVYDNQRSATRVDGSQAVADGLPLMTAAEACRAPESLDEAVRLYKAQAIVRQITSRSRQSHGATIILDTDPSHPIRFEIAVQTLEDGILMQLKRGDPTAPYLVPTGFAED